MSPEPPRAIATFANVHAALAAERKLKKGKVPVDLIPTPRMIRSDCGYVLVLELGSGTERARRLELLAGIGAESLWFETAGPEGPIKSKERMYERYS